MDADRKLYTFNNWFKVMYNKENSIISVLFDFDDLEQGKDGYKIHLYKEKSTIEKNIIDKRVNYKKEQIHNFLEKNEKLQSKGFYPFRLSGDADYELLDKKKCKNPRMHMFPNFSLLPVTGNLQIIKNNRPLKTFLLTDLQGDFVNRDILSVPYRKWGRQYKNEEKNTEKEICEKEVLKAFFDIFDSLDEYCKSMYFLNAQEIKELDINKYWEKRKEISKKYGISEEIMKYDLSLKQYK